MMVTLSDLTDFPSEGNSQGVILGYQVIYFPERNFVFSRYCKKVRLILQRNQMLIKAVCLLGGHSVVCSRPVQNFSILFLILLMLLHLTVWRYGECNWLVCLLWTLL